MDVDFFVQQVVNGLTLGCVYALIALGYTMVYGILKLLNFAHGEVFMMGAFVGYGVLTLFGGPLALTVPRRAADHAHARRRRWSAAGFLGVLIERFAYRPLRNAPRIAPLISALGVSFFLQNVGAAPLRRRLPHVRHLDLIDLANGIHWGPLHISVVRILVDRCLVRADDRADAARRARRASARRCARRPSTARPLR